MTFVSQSPSVQESGVDVPVAVPVEAKADPSSPAPYLWMTASSASFTLMGVLTQSLAGRCDWALVAFARALLACLFAAALVWHAGAAFVVLRPRSIWLRSISGSASMVLTFYALPRLPIANTLTLTNMSPIWIALLSWPLLGHRLTRSVWLAVILGIAGVALIQRPKTEGDVVAAWCAAAASISTAFAMIGLHGVKHLDARAIVAHFSAVAAMATGATCLIAAHGRAPSLPSDMLSYGLLFGVGATGTLGQILMTRAYAIGQPARVAVVGLSQVLFALLIDMLFWRRSFDGPTLLGIALIVAPSGWLMALRK